MSFWKAMIAIGAIIIVLGLLLATGYSNWFWEPANSAEKLQRLYNY